MAGLLINGFKKNLIKIAHYKKDFGIIVLS